MGHFDRVCGFTHAPRDANNQVRVIQPRDPSDDGPLDLDPYVPDAYPESDDYDDYGVFRIAPKGPSDKPKKPTITLCLAGHVQAPFLVDTGSCVTLMSKEVVQELFGHEAKLRPLTDRERNIRFVDYNNQEVKKAGKLICSVSTNGWTVQKATIFVTEHRLGNILGTDLHDALGIQLTQSANGRLYPIRNVNTAGKHYHDLVFKYSNLFSRSGRMNHHVVRTKFKQAFQAQHQKGRRVPIGIQPQVDAEIKRLLEEGHIEKVNACTDDQFISPILITVKRDKSVKLALDARQLNKFIHRKKYQMPNIEELLDNIAQIITDTNGSVWFTSLDLKYAYGQITLSKETSLQCNFCLVGGAATGTYRFKTGFYGLADMPAEFQHALDMLLQRHPAAHAFLDDVLIVSCGTRAEHLAKVDAVL